MNVRPASFTFKAHIHTDAAYFKDFASAGMLLSKFQSIPVF
jgi:hypothetical protein